MSITLFSPEIFGCSKKRRRPNDSSGYECPLTDTQSGNHTIHHGRHQDDEGDPVPD